MTLIDIHDIVNTLGESLGAEQKTSHSRSGKERHISPRVRSAARMRCCSEELKFAESASYFISNWKNAKRIGWFTLYFQI